MSITLRDVHEDGDLKGAIKDINIEIMSCQKFSPLNMTMIRLQNGNRVSMPLYVTNSNGEYVLSQDGQRITKKDFEGNVLFFTIEIEALKKQVISLPQDYQVFKDYVVNSPYNEDCLDVWANGITKYFMIRFEGHEELEEQTQHENSQNAYSHVIKLSNKQIEGYSILLGLVDPDKNKIEPQRERERAQIIKNYALDKPVEYIRNIVNVDDTTLAFNIFMKMAQKNMCIRHDGAVFKTRVNGKGDITIGSNYDACMSALNSNQELFTLLKEKSGFAKWASKSEPIDSELNNNDEVIKKMEAMMQKMEAIERENEELKSLVNKPKTESVKTEEPKKDYFGRAQREAAKKAELELK